MYKKKRLINSYWLNNKKVLVTKTYLSSNTGIKMLGFRLCIRRN